MFHSFTCRESDLTGDNGWVLDAKPYFDPMLGMGVAHDVLEEMPHGGEQPHDELMALGAFLYGRASMDMARIGKNLAYEFEALFSHAFNEQDYNLAEAPSVRRLDYRGWHECEEEIIQGIAPKVIEYIDTYAENEWDDFENNIPKAKAWIPHAQNWLRIGFRRAYRRFQPHMDGPEVAYMFERMTKAVDQIPLELDDTLMIRVSYQRNNFELWHNRELVW